MARKAKANKKKTVEPKVDVNPIETEIEADVEIKKTVEPKVDVNPIETEDTLVKNSVKDRVKKNAEQFTQAYFDEADCNYRFTGEWQKVYASMVNRLFPLKDKTTLDIGGAFGAISMAFTSYGAKATNLDISKYAIESKLFNVINQVHSSIQNMKKIEDKSVDFVHISHVLNYVDNKDIKRSLSEVYRIMKTDSKCMIIMEFGKVDKNKFQYSQKEFDTVIKSIGFKNITEETKKEIAGLPKSINMFNEYKWDFVILQK